MSDIIYCYDGSFAGFLCCLAESAAQGESPCDFVLPREAQFSLYPARSVESDPVRARQVYATLRAKLTADERRFVEHGFLTCLPRRESYLYTYLCAALQGEPIRDPTDPRIYPLQTALIHLMREAEHLQGFARFSDYDGVLVGEITPKNQILPLLRHYFCSRLPNETFLLFDKTNKQALCQSQGQCRILPLESLELQEPGPEENAYRTLWRRFYDTIAIESRKNPKLRMSHMPKRFWADMTEFQ